MRTIFSFASDLSWQRAAMHTLLFFALFLASLLGALVFSTDRGGSAIASLTPSEFQKLSLTDQAQLLLSLGDEGVPLGELTALVREAYPDQPPSRHELGHVLGEVAVKQFGIDGFGMCDSFLAYGCFHGAAFQAVRMSGFDPHLGDSLWESCKRLTPEPGSCLHGLGHALVALHQYDVTTSLSECDRLLAQEQEGSAFWCWDGVFMENISRNAVAEGQVLQPAVADVEHPCAEFAARYEAACARNTIAWLRDTLSLSVPQMFSACHSFTQEYSVQECIEIVGSIVAGQHFEDPQHVSIVCKDAEGYYRECVLGAVSAYGMAEQIERGLLLCDQLPASDQSSCIGRMHIASPNQ